MLHGARANVLEQAQFASGESRNILDNNLN